MLPLRVLGLQRRSRVGIMAAISPAALMISSIFLYEFHALPEMHIANNGLVLLRGAQVTSVSGDTIQVEMIWNSVQFTWTVQTDSNTQFFAPTGERETSSSVQTGSVITVTGMLEQD